MFNKMAEPGKKYRLFVVGETALFYQWRTNRITAQYRTVITRWIRCTRMRRTTVLTFLQKQPEKYIRHI